jgi:hypothetical protein
VISIAFQGAGLTGITKERRTAAAKSVAPINFFPDDFSPGNGALIDSSIIRLHSAGYTKESEQKWLRDNYRSEQQTILLRRTSNETDRVQDCLEQRPLRRPSDLTSDGTCKSPQAKHCFEQRSAALSRKATASAKSARRGIAPNYL